MNKRLFFTIYIYSGLTVKAKITASKILKLKDAYQGDERLFCLGCRFSGNWSEA